MKTSLWIFIVALSCVAAKRTGRQTKDQDCSLGTHTEARCVPNDLCQPKLKPQCSDFEDIDYLCVKHCNPVIIGPRNLISLENRQDQAKQAECPSGKTCCHEDSEFPSDDDDEEDEEQPDVVFQDPLCVLPNSICCPEEDVQTITYDTFDCANSKDKTEEGLGCHVSDDCEADTVQGNGHCAPDYNAATNEITPKKCCVKKRAPGAHCSDLEKQHFQCIHRDRCNERLKDYGDDKVDPEAVKPPLLDVLRQSRSARCDNDVDVCCHFLYIDQPPCDEYADDEYGCRKKSKCMDSIFPELTYDIKRFGDCSGSFGKNNICCKNKKPKEVTEAGDTCSGGYGCGQLHLCDLTEPVLKSTNSPLLNYDKEKDTFTIDNDINKCEKETEVCCKLPGRPQRPADPPYQPKCGTRNPTGLGVEATSPQDKERSTRFGEWPFACLLYGSGDEFLGGASLITSGILLTAFHNLINDDGLIEAEDIRVRCGDWDIETEKDEELYPAQDRKLSSYSFHPGWLDQNFKNDVALLFVDEDFKLNKHLDTVCLPNIPLDRENNYLSSGCVVMGWGSRAELEASERPLSQAILEAVHDVPLFLDNDVCEDEIRTHANVNLDQSVFCAGGAAGMDSCEGDGGGPLVCPHNATDDRYVLAGVVEGGVPGSGESGNGCGVANAPGIYASVVDNLCFIHWVTKCKVGEKYRANYWYPQCKDWMKDLKPTLTRSVQRSRAEDLEDSCSF